MTTAPNNGMPLMTPDSAWRQWRRAATDVKTQEENQGAAFGPAKKAAEQAKYIWLQTMLEHFERRRGDAVEDGHGATTDEELFALLVPCIDCLRVVGANDGDPHQIHRDETKLYPVWATCGITAIDPTKAEMPTW